MREIDKFKIIVPELGDRPNIEVVTQAIEDVGNAFSGTIEMAKAVRNGARLTLSSSRTVERTGFYSGLTIQFVSGFSAKIGEITDVQIDSLPVQPVTFLNDVVVGEFCLLQYGTNGFTCTVVSGKLPDDVMRTGGIEVTGKDLEDKKADRDELYLASAPIGAMHLYPSHIIPVGWLLCDGRTITEEDYPELFKLIGNKLPDMRGQFARGLDNGKGIDSGREMGSYQGDAIRNITGTSEFTSASRVWSPYNMDGAKGVFAHTNPYGRTFKDPSQNAGLSIRDSDTISFDASRVVPTAPENRPKNVAYNYIIKASYLTSVPVAVDVATDLNSKIETNYNNHQEAIINNDGQSVGWNGITYIQDVGEKVEGKLYYDKLQSGLWYCKTTNNDVVNTSNFEDWSNYSNGDKVKDLSTSYSVDITPYAVPFNGRNLLTFCVLHRNKNTVNISLDFQGVDIAGLPIDTKIGQLPPEIRPTKRSFGMLVGSDNKNCIVLAINPNGNIHLSAPTTGISQSFFGSISYFVEG